MAILRAIAALGRRKNRRTHELHPILRMQFVQFLEFCGVLRIERELRGLVKELFESGGLAHKDQLASSRAFVAPTMRKIPRQPDASAGRQVISLTARFEEEVTGQDVVPFLFAVMHMPRRTVSRESSQLKDGTRPAAVASRNLTVNPSGYFLRREGVPIFAGFGDGRATG